MEAIECHASSLIQTNTWQANPIEKKPLVNQGHQMVLTHQREPLFS